tara:strand:+ start:9209 stop:9805 length:597 start_codon:yes stop_codon:yes gene_type:complete
MSCKCSAKDKIRRMKNIYYIDYTLPFNSVNADRPFLANGWELNIPMGTQNIKANHALISIDKFCLRGNEIARELLYPLIVQTTIPCANRFITTNPLPFVAPAVASSVNQWRTPTLATYAETINLSPFHVVGAADAAQIAHYQNDNPDRKVLVPNPMGKSYRMTFFGTEQDTGSRIVAVGIGHSVSLTLRIELLEEEII